MADQATGLLSSWLRRRRMKIACPHIKGRVLDYGCGVGILSEMCTAGDYYGVDIDEESLQTARHRYPTSFFATEIPENMTFDTIVLLAVIEHIKMPDSFLRGLKDKLNSCGAIVLTTPHPQMEEIHRMGAKIGLFSAAASEEHESLIDYGKMLCISRAAGLDISVYRRFLFGANQLFVLTVGDPT